MVFTGDHLALLNGRVRVRKFIQLLQRSEMRGRTREPDFPYVHLCLQRAVTGERHVGAAIGEDERRIVVAFHAFPLRVHGG
jgi:hypothetical protein